MRAAKRSTSTRRASAGAMGRGARRRSETRARLVRAARELMARKGIHATSIQEITDTADVGFGSFYNHFPSKEAIAEAVMQEALEAFGAAGDRMAPTIADPAEILAFAIRYAVRRSQVDEAFGRFLMRTALVATGFMRHALGKRLVRDVQAGFAAGRFAAADPPAAMLAAGGTVLACIAGVLNGELPDDAPERTATIVLQILGMSPREAARVARRPLPPLDDVTAAALVPAEHGGAPSAPRRQEKTA